MTTTKKFPATCEQCAEPFMARYRVGEGSRFCSPRCRARHQVGQVRRRDCGGCGQAFEYTPTRGADRLYCGDDCQRAAHGRMRDAKRAAALTPCRTPRCGGRVVFRVGQQQCEACYTYERKNGRPRNPLPLYSTARVYLRRDGYLVVRAPGHPLESEKRSYVALHRLVAHDARGGVCGGCHWCDAPLTWASAHVDHLNGEKADNRPENLVVSCRACNQGRGAGAAFLRRLNPERFDQAVALMLPDGRPGEARQAR